MTLQIRLPQFCRRVLPAILILPAYLQPAQSPDQSCKVIDLMPEFWQVVAASDRQSPEEQVRAFRAALVSEHSDLFGRDGLGFQSAAGLDSAMVKSLAYARQHEASIRHTEDLLKRNLPSYLLAFRERFPDFRCNFPIYIMPSLGQLDAAGRRVDNMPSLLFGVDVIADEHSPASLRILAHHELFHRYHYQVAGFSDDKAEGEVLWKTLWAEGLATYASMKLNPPASVQEALFVPKDLVQRSQPLLPGLIPQIEASLDRVDPELFSKFFLYHGPEATPPSRVGYYIGALAAREMAKRHSPYSLAHMQARQVRVELERALKQLQ